VTFLARGAQDGGVDEYEAHYLLYRGTRQGNATMWLQRLNAEGTATIGQWRALIRADRADENHVVEAPAMVRYTTPTRRAMFVAGLSWTNHDHPVLVLLDDRHERHRHDHPHRGEPVGMMQRGPR
jgi:hypothetical protein